MCGEKTTGLFVLINDTEKLIIYDVGDYEYSPETKSWTGSFYFQTFDNFGLDNDDLIEHQYNRFFGEGIAAWWILQHIRSNSPFPTELRHVYKL